MRKNLDTTWTLPIVRAYPQCRVSPNQHWFLTAHFTPDEGANSGTANGLLDSLDYRSSPGVNMPASVIALSAPR